MCVDASCLGSYKQSGIYAICYVHVWCPCARQIVIPRRVALPEGVFLEDLERDPKRVLVEAHQKEPLLQRVFEGSGFMEIYSLTILCDLQPGETRVIIHEGQ